MKVLLVEIRVNLSHFWFEKFARQTKSAVIPCYENFFLFHA